MNFFKGNLFKHTQTIKYHGIKIFPNIQNFVFLSGKKKTTREKKFSSDFWKEILLLEEYLQLKDNE